MSKPSEIVVTTPDALEDCCAELAQSKLFGLDTEFVGEASYHPELCLIQVATEASLYLIDPFAFESLAEFWRVVVDPAHVVVVHAGREEVRLCQLACGTAPTNVFDLQLAAGLAGLQYPISHGNLVEGLLHKKIAKGETLTEWRCRPLTRDQIAYAFDDVRYLVPLHRKLHKRLEELGRLGWAREEFARLSQQSQADENGLLPTGDKWRKLKGTSALDRRRLAIVRALYQWREELAHRTNRPPRALLRDDLVVEIARRNPRTANDLHVVRGLAKKHAETLMSVIEAAQRLPLTDCPVPQEREVELPQVGFLVNVLGAVLADWCGRHSLASNLAASVGDLKTLVKSRLQRGQLPGGSLLSMGWREEHLLPVLQAFLQGETSLRVSDIQAATPFVVG